jgi:hypothetical protein
MFLFPERYVRTPQQRRAHPAWIWEGYGHRLGRILAAGGFSIHDVVNDARVRTAVREQWRLLRFYEEEQAIEATLAYLERQGGVSL